MREQAVPLTVLLERAADGDREANDDLFASIYPTLKSMARRQLNQHRRDTLSTTELVNEAAIRLFDAEQLEQLANRRHLMATAAQVMRHILVDHARRRQSKKRGGDWHRLDLDEGKLSVAQLSEQVLALDEALTRLGAIDSRGHQVVELKFFGGCSIDEIADLLDVSSGTVKLAWRKARAFLYAEMSER